MSSPPPAAAGALSGAAFATLLLIALMMGANHVAARVAFEHGVDVVTAVTIRSGITAAAVSLLLVVYRVPIRLEARHAKVLCRPRECRSPTCFLTMPNDHMTRRGGVD